MPDAQTEAEAIWQAMTAFGGDQTISRVTSWIAERYPGRWKDVGTAMADLALPGNVSSHYASEQRFLERVDIGPYRVRQRGLFRIGS